MTAALSAMLGPKEGASAARARQRWPGRARGAAAEQRGGGAGGPRASAPRRLEPAAPGAGARGEDHQQRVRRVDLERKVEERDVTAGRHARRAVAGHRRRQRAARARACRRAWSPGFGRRALERQQRAAGGGAAAGRACEVGQYFAVEAAGVDSDRVRILQAKALEAQHDGQVAGRDRPRALRPRPARRAQRRAGVGGPCRLRACAVGGTGRARHAARRR